MEDFMMEIDSDGQQQIVPDALPFARSYQLEALNKAIHENTIVYLETGSGKTLIAIMLLRSYASYLRKSNLSPYIAVFLVPKVVLVSQQAKALRSHTDLKVGMYWGDMGVDYWDEPMWKQEMEKNEEFYHKQLKSGISELPRIFGMTASPIKSKGGKSIATLSKHIRELMTLMHSKVYTCVSEAVISQFIPTSTPKFKFYKTDGVQYALFEQLAVHLNSLKQKHKLALESSDFTTSAAESANKKITKVFAASLFCLDELGVWLALKAAESLSFIEIETTLWGSSADKVVESFSSATVMTLKNSIPSGPRWTIGDNMKSDVDMGLLTPKVCCLIESLLEYRGLSDMRCIVFVERVVTAVVLPDLLNALLTKYNSWRATYIAGCGYKLQSQSRKKQNQIVEDFRMGLVNIIVATSILEEGLDVQSCNLVIRFDPCPVADPGF